MTTEGKFVWYELVTSDPAAAEQFYSKVVGWTMADSGMTEMRYTLAKIGDRHVAGLMGFPPDMPNPQPGWMGYILTTDVDATVGRVQQAGGALYRAPADIPNVGRFAVVADPDGAVFMLFRGAGEPAPDVPAETPGRISWHELHAKDREKAFAFYQGLFGWEKADAMDMGGGAIYQIVAMGGVPEGAIFTNADAPRPFWLFYFYVDDIDAAVSRLTEGGGRVANGPMEVPGGVWIVQAFDPQGAMFALVGPKH